MKYKTLSFEDANKLGYVGLDDYHNYEYRHGVFIIEDDKPVDMLGCDGGEPEDNTLFRDWAWIADALNEAYCAGLSDGNQVKVRTATFAYDVIEYTLDRIMLVDQCEEHGRMSITNAAEAVIDDLREKHMLEDNTRVYYKDTMGEIDELCHDGDRFIGFAPGSARKK